MLIRCHFVLEQIVEPLEETLQHIWGELIHTLKCQRDMMQGYADMAIIKSLAERGTFFTTKNMPINWSLELLSAPMGVFTPVA